MSHRCLNLIFFSIKDDEKNRAVIGLLCLLKKRDVEVAKLREEIARLKNHPLKPKLKPSMISKKDKSIRNKKKSHLDNSTQKGKSKKIEIHEIKRSKPDNIPEGSKLVRLRPYKVIFYCK